VRSEERLTTEQYQPYVDAFTPDEFDPETWADVAARAGMKYAVLTAKHHDGLCLYDSALTDYTTMHNGFGRDVVAEFLSAFRARGIKVGLYYSLLDWHHPDYPAYGDMFHPQRDDPAWQGHQPQFDRYLTYMHSQVEELCTNYGQLDLLWFDFSYDQMRSESWRAEELVSMVRRLQPDVLIDNRLETSADGFGSIVTPTPSAWSGDFVSPEQLIPSEGIVNHAGDPVPWEACVTLNNHWGYVPDDQDYKSARMIVRKLVETVSKGGNLLLNVGPDPRGVVPAGSVVVLEEVGRWIADNGASLYGAGSAEFAKPDWGYYTCSGDTVFAHIFEPPIGPVALTGIDPARIRSMSLVRDGSVVELAESWLTEAYPNTAFVSFGEIAAFTYPLPDDIDTVIAIRLEPLPPAS